MNLSENLKKLSDKDLVENMKKFITCERVNLVSFLAHLGEASGRRLYLKDGYSSLFEYCTKFFGISEGSAYKRIQVAKASVQFPLILRLLKENKITLTAASLVCPHIDPMNNEQRLLEACGKSKMEILKLTAIWKPKPEPNESMRKAPMSALKIGKTYAGDNFECQKNKPSKSLATTNSSALKLEPSKEKLEPISSQRSCLRFSVSEKVEAKIKRAREVLAQKKDFTGSLEDIFDRALEALLDKEDPQRREKRREKRAQKKENSPKTSRKIHHFKKQTRYIPQKTRDSVLRKWNYQCSYVSPSGKSCTCKTGLELDHIKPYAKKGSNAENNLQPLCKQHNLLKAQEQYGRVIMDRFWNG